MKSKGPKWKFDIYFAPRNYPHYVTVCIHETRDQMQSSRASERDGYKAVEAFYRPSEITEKIKIEKDGTEIRQINNCYGEVHFCPDSLTFANIAHELFHAVTVWSFRNGCAPRDEEGDEKKEGYFIRPTTEELCAETMGELMGQTMFGIYRALSMKEIRNTGLAGYIGPLIQRKRNSKRDPSL